MRIVRALGVRSIRWLWSGQVFSAMGDEVYNIAMVWFATALLGLDAGYISAIQAGAIFFFSLVGGVWADHRDPRRVMIAADLIRGFAVLTLPLAGLFWTLNLWLLVPVAVIVSSLAAFFNPALTAFLPRLIQDRTLLQTTNGLMETTTRIARVIGPGCIGILGRFVPLLHYFTLDALSFFASAYSIAKIRELKGHPVRTEVRQNLRDALIGGFTLSRRVPVINYLLFSGAIVGAAWLFVFPLGMALMIRERLHAEVGALGLIVFAYGVGNLSSNLILANLNLRRPEVYAFSGRILAGVGFLLLAYSQTLNQMMWSCALAATGGPMTDLGFVNLVQDSYRDREISRIFRFGNALSYGCLLIGLLVSPFLFRVFTVPSVVAACALSILFFGAVGLACFRTCKTAN